MKKEINKNEVKQVILVNSWVDMPPGKVAAQVSHASMVFLAVKAKNSGVEVKDDVVVSTIEWDSDFWDNWFVNGTFAKLVLAVRSQEEYNQVVKRLEKNGLIINQDYFEIIDHGRTVFDGVPTHTCTGFISMLCSQESLLLKVGRFKLLIRVPIRKLIPLSFLTRMKKILTLQVISLKDSTRRQRHS